MKKLFFIFVLFAVAMSAFKAQASFTNLYICGDINGNGWEIDNRIPLSNPENGWFKLELSSVGEFKVSSANASWNDGFNSNAYQFTLSDKAMNGVYDGTKGGGNSSVPSTTKVIYFRADLKKCAISDGKWEPDPWIDPTLSGGPFTVKVDVTAAGWKSGVCIHHWDGSIEETTWPGVAMSDEGNNIWSYTFENGAPEYIIFNINTEQTVNLDFEPGKTYVLQSKNSKGQWTATTIDNEEENPVEMVTYEVWLHTKWTAAYAKVWDAAHGNKSYTGTGTYGQEIFMDPGHSNNFLLRFTCSATNPQLKIKFSNGDADYLLESEAFDVINHHIYTAAQGDQGDVDEFNGGIENPDPTTPILPDLEYWLSPSKPKQNEKARLYFNRSKSSKNELKTTDEIWTWLGVADADKKWTHGPSGDWDKVSSQPKYKMTRDGNTDIYYIDFDPTIEDWIGFDRDERPVYLAFIFRNSAGNQSTADLFLELGKMPAPTTGLGAYVSYEPNDQNGITIQAEGGTVQITPFSPEVIKVFTLKSGAKKTVERRSISVIDPDDKSYCFYEIPNSSFDINEDDASVNIKFFDTVEGSDGVTVCVNKEDCRLSFYQNGKRMLAEDGGLRNASNGGSSSISFQGMGDAGFYGGGYNGNRMNWDGTSMIMRNTQTGNWAQGSSHPHNINIPYYVSTSGYGVYVDDHYISATLTPSADGTVYSSESEDPIAYYFVGGGTMERAMQNYTLLTGRQKLPPFWALGYISSKFSFASESEADDNIASTKNMGLPLDAIVFDIHWQGGVTKMGKLDWDTDNYRSGTGIYKKYSDQNIHTINISEPYFTSNSGNYEAAKNNGYFAHANCEGMGWLNSSAVGLIDASNEAAMDWFYELYKKHTKAGLGAWWYDLGEPENHTGGSTHQGGSMNQIRNEFGNLWTGGIHRRTQRDYPDMRHITMPRAGTAGMQRYGAMPWTGDIARSWAGLAAQVPATVSASMSGVGYLGSDIGGFIANGTDAKMYLRWVQLGILYPSMRTHSANTPEPWQGAYSTYHNEIVKAVRQRYAYLPYTYTLAYQNTYLGSPTSRPANFHDSDPSRLNNVIDAYYWGRDLYVAPILSNNNTRTIRLPEGDWLNMKTLEIVEGNQDITYTAANDELPHFLRRGAFLTRYTDADNCTSTADLDRSKLIIDYVSPTDPAIRYSQYYEDDHTTPDPVNTPDENDVTDHYILTTMHGIRHGDLVLHFNRQGNGYKGMPERQSVVLRVHDFTLADDDPVILTEHDNTNAPRAKATANLSKTNSYDDVANASDNCFATDGDKAYIHVNLDPMKSYSLQLGKTTPTGVDDISTDHDYTLTLNPGEGYLAYTAAQGLTDVAIEIFTPTGALVARYDNLTADGYLQQLHTTLPAGLYIARLTARTPTATLTATTKYKN